MSNSDKKYLVVEDESVPDGDFDFDQFHDSEKGLLEELDAMGPFERNHAEVRVWKEVQSNDGETEYNLSEKYSAEMVHQNGAIP